MPLDGYFPPIDPEGTRNVVTRRELDVILSGLTPPTSRAVMSQGIDEVATTSVDGTETVAHTKTLSNLPLNTVVTVDMTVALQVTAPADGDIIEVRPSINGTALGVVAKQTTHASIARVTKRYISQLTVDESGEIVLGVAVRYTGGSKTNQESEIQWMVWR